MDGPAWIVIVCLLAVLVRVVVPAAGPGMNAHVAALSQLLGGWRPLPWPRGVQEDDPEAAWANHREAEVLPPSGASIEDLD